MFLKNVFLCLGQQTFRMGGKTKKLKNVKSPGEAVENSGLYKQVI
jgi:hypothetical protein